MIPKIIHYCWFGKQKKPAVVQKCITSWKQYCPDWKIKEWNESNFDITRMPYMQEAYENKKWAFVSDVARLLIVYQEGGVYLDADVELLGSIEVLLKNDAFFAFENERNINTGLGFGAVKNHPVIKKMVEFYEAKHFVQKNRTVLIPCPAGNTAVIQSFYHKFIRNGELQILENTLILGINEYSDVARHHEVGTWVEGDKILNRKYKDFWIKRFLRRPEKFDFVDKYFGRKGVSLYTFLVYDLLEYGLAYYVRRLMSKTGKRE